MSKIFIISELGHNFMGNIRLAKLMIDESKASGADAVKLQLYDTDKIKRHYHSRYSELKYSELNKEEFFELKAHADKIGIELFASAFDVERVKWCEEAGVKRHKLASRSIYDEELIKAMVATGKPIIASLGMVDKRGIPNIEKAEYLYCVSEYPAYISQEQFPKKFNEVELFSYTGFSDHSDGTYWCKEAIRRGATIIEKHFTLDKKLPGFDQAGSADVTELKEIVQFARQTERGINHG